MIEPPEPAPDSLSHVRLGRNTALSAAAIGVLGLTRLAYNIVAGRRFGPAALGEATLAINAAMFASLAVSGGWQTSAARFVAEALGAQSPGSAAWIYRRMRAHNAAGGAVVGVLTWAGLRYAPGIDLPARDALLAGVIVFVYNEYTFLKAALYGFGRVQTYLRIETVSSLSLVAALAVVAATGRRPWLLVPVIAGYAIFGVAAWLRVHQTAAAPARIDVATWRSIRRFTILAVAGTLASAGFLNLSPVFAGRYATPVDLGRFSAALALIVPVYFVPRALALALFPSIAFRYGQNRIEDVRTQLDGAGRALAVALLAPVAVAAVAAPLVLRVVFGAAFQPGAWILAVMLGATYISVVQIPYVTALSGTRRSWYRIPVLASVAGFAAGLVLWVAFGRRYGAAGVAWGYLIGSVPQAAIPIAFAARVFHLRVTSLTLRVAVVWVVAAATVLPWKARVDAPVSLVRAAVVLAAYAALFAGDVSGLLRDAGRRRRARAG